MDPFSEIQELLTGFKELLQKHPNLVLETAAAQKIRALFGDMNTKFLEMKEEDIAAKLSEEKVETSLKEFEGKDKGIKETQMVLEIMTSTVEGFYYQRVARSHQTLDPLLAEIKGLIVIAKTNNEEARHLVAALNKRAKGKLERNVNNLE